MSLGGFLDCLRLHLKLLDGSLHKPVSEPYRQAVSLRKTPTAVILEEENLFINSLVVFIGQAKKSPP